MKKKIIKIICAAAFAVILYFLPSLIESNYYMGVMNFALINAIIALGFNFIFGYVGYISFAQAAFMGVGAYTSALLSLNFEWHFGITLLFACFVSLIFGLIMGFPALKLKGPYLAFVTLGFTLVLQLVLNNWVSFTGGFNGLTRIPSPQFGELIIRSNRQYYYFVLGFLIILAFAAYRIERSRMGRAFFSIREDELAAGASGVNVRYYKIMAFMLSALYSGIGGVLYAHMLNYIAPATFSFDHSIVIFTMVLLGGSGNIKGPIIGAILLTFFPEWLRFMRGFYMAVYGAGIVLLLMFMPEGIVGGLSKLYKFAGSKIKPLKAG